jgi:hypothetical protein
MKLDITQHKISISRLVCYTLYIIIIVLLVYYLVYYISVGQEDNEDFTFF